MGTEEDGGTVRFGFDSCPRLFVTHSFGAKPGRMPRGGDERERREANKRFDLSLIRVPASPVTQTFGPKGRKFAARGR